MPLGAENKFKSAWNSVSETCEKKLVSLEGQYLSLWGRLTLVNSVLDALPTYMMSLFPMPLNVANKLDEVGRNFLWQGNSPTKKIHLVKWDIVTKCKKEGGISVKNLRIQKQSLMLKWLWRFSTPEQSLW